MSNFGIPIWLLLLLCSECAMASNQNPMEKCKRLQSSVSQSGVRKICSSSMSLSHQLWSVCYISQCGSGLNRFKPLNVIVFDEENPKIISICGHQVIYLILFRATTHKTDWNTHSNYSHPVAEAAAHARSQYLKIQHPEKQCDRF